MRILLSLLLLHPTKCAWIDEDTPESLHTTTSLVDGTEYQLVMSDEFNVPGRSFKDGHDPTWTALDKSDDDYSASGGGSLHFYNSSTVTTTPDGMLTISTVMDSTEWNHYDPIEKEWVTKKQYFKSGMLQSWDKFCFTGGILEVDVILPGEPDIGGLWPAVWLLGNLGRATYEASTNNIWPWSYDQCDRQKQESQSISACNEANHFGLNKFQGRGATEIDLLELMGGELLLADLIFVAVLIRSSHHFHVVKLHNNCMNVGNSNGALPATSPPISLPYVDMTLQVSTKLRF
jgi:beta-glucanase (GH16 family)